MTFDLPDIAARVITRREVVERLGVSDRTLYCWAKSGYGPRPFIAGGVALYDRVDIDAFEALHGSAQ